MKTRSNLEIELDAAATEAEKVEQDLPSLELIYTEVKDKLEVQLRQIDALDSKSGTLIFVASIVIGVGAAAQAAILGTFSQALPTILFSVPIIFYVLTVIIGMRSWVRHPYYRDPEPRPLRDYYMSEPHQFTKRRLLAHFISSYEWNATMMNKKVSELRYAVVFFSLQVISLTLVLASRPWLNLIFEG